MNSKPLLWVMVLALFSCGKNSTQNQAPLIIEGNELTIAFGSCAHSYDTLTIFTAIESHKPAIWVWLGDIIYGDSHDMAVLKEKYDKQKNKPEYQKLMANSKVIGIWDDHDYGVNDGGKYYSKKDESKELLLDFLDVEKDDPVRSRKGAYSDYNLQIDEKHVKIILLDTRYFRDTLDPDFNSTKRYLPNEEGDILGEEQWQWFERVLRKSKADFHIIGSGIQVISDEHGYEKWANFPRSRDRMFRLIAEINPSPVIFISGDRHIAEVSKLDIEGLSYPLYDFTASGLTHTWGTYWPEPNQYRVDSLIVSKNFGLLKLSWNDSGLAVALEVRGEKNELIQRLEITY